MSLINDFLAIYKLWVDFLFSFQPITGVPIGYIIVACSVMGYIIHYLYGRIR